jgi:hypothetical protein
LQCCALLCFANATPGPAMPRQRCALLCSAIALQCCARLFQCNAVVRHSAAVGGRAGLRRCVTGRRGSGRGWGRRYSRHGRESAF